MNLLNQLMAIGRNLGGLGPARLVALGGVGLLTIFLILGAAIYLNKPTMETLYVGLETTDANQISIALAEAGIPFQTSADGNTIQVGVGKTSQARLLLAERGLPNSTTSGYELFDQVGSLGLTSFMQEVTRVRALEGEIARTILAINGITAARVHIVLPDVGSFRRGAQKPTASVMIRAGTSTGRKAAVSIRHLVAASVPGLSPDDVTVLDSTGQLLASGEEYGNSGATRSLSTEQQVQSDIETNIDKALAPFLGMDNFRASVVAKLNTDAQQIQETIYDPESRVERSVRVTKEAQKSQSVEANAATTVEQNVPQGPGATGGGSGPSSNDESDKKEELTNYEINSKTIATVRNTYTIEHISVAVVVNKARIQRLAGENADQAQIDAYVEEMKKIVQTAAALDSDRGDKVEITVMDFLESEILDEAAASPGMGDTITRYLGTIINALAFVAVAFLIVWFGFRPLARSMGGGALVPAGGASLPGMEAESDSLGLELPDFAPAAMGGDTGQLMEGFGADFGFDSTEDILGGMEDANEGEFNRKVKQGPERRLSKMVDISEERAAKILRKWAADRAA